MLSAAPASVLIGDDQPGVLEALRLLLKADGLRPELAQSPAAVLSAAASRPFDLFLIDMNYARDTTSGQEGLDLLSALQRSHRAPVVVMTAWGSIELAVEAMRRGAADFVQKPWDNDRLLTTLKKHLDRGQSQRTEIEIARAVQQNLFPHAGKTLGTIQYAAECRPARAVSGDYYDFLDAGDGALAFVLADVSGKGMPAALLMANLQASLRSQPASLLVHPARMLETVNRLFYEATPPERYATLVYACYDDDSHLLRYVNCGHPPPLLRRAHGTLERLQPTATVLGLFPHWECAEATVQLSPGDTLLVTSDGVTEASNDDDWLNSCLQTSPYTAPAALAAHILDAAERFTPGARPDDLTALVISAA